MSSATIRDGGPPDLEIEQAVDDWLERQAIDKTEKTVRDYRKRLTNFVEWCEEQDITHVSELSGYTYDRFQAYRAAQGHAATTLKGGMTTLRLWTRWLANIDAVDESLPDKIDVPQPTRREETSDVKLDADWAHELLDHYRSQRASYGDRIHTLFEVLWWTGARLGAIHGLDVDDVTIIRDDEGEVTAARIEFQHRPTSGTPLKKKDRGERVVGVPEPVGDVLAVYLEEHRPAVRDDQGREPLFATTGYGRPSAGTLRDWTYHATIPCRHSECPHDEQPATCDWNSQKGASGCPSSRSPHQIRTGEITWMLNRGMSWEAVGHRVNSDPDTLRRYYDKASAEERWERHNEELDKLDFQEDDDNA